MSTTGIIVLVVLVILALLIIAAVMAVMRKRRTRGLRERFGSEYDRTVDEHGSRRKAEHQMAGSAHRRDKVEIRDLDPLERQRYARTWTDVQSAFVDDPWAATRDADRLVGAVMRDRGYPVDDFATKSDMIAMDHADLAEHYRQAHEIGSRSEEPSTEELRRGFVHYRALFDKLLGGPQADGAVADDERLARDGGDGQRRVIDESVRRDDGVGTDDAARDRDRIDLTRDEHAAEHRRMGG